ncbi:MAG: cyclic nucleotide-binding domain-containing protein, partial [Betaproteobacteria bacterium]
MAQARVGTHGTMPSSPAVTYHDFATTPLGQSLAPEDGEAVAHRLERRVAVPGEVIFRQGDPGDRLYVVLTGRLCASVTGGDGAVQRLGEIGPGELVGETALLRGTPRLATVQAVAPTELAVLDASAWQELRTRLPQLETAVARALDWRERTSDLRRFRPGAAWVCAWLGRTELLAGTDPSALEALEGELMWETLPAGEVLVQVGDPGECMWLVVRGRLRASVHRPAGVTEVVGDIGPGECVGEMALLSEAPR